MIGNRICLLILIGALLSAGCDHADKKVLSSPPAASRKVALMQPFRFHKMIEVAPGNDFDIYSWGRGSSETGSFIILHSDSAGMKYTTTTGDLDGAIIDVFNTDMDVDGNPEILIQAKTTDTNSFTKVYAFEFNGAKADKLEFPRLSKSQRKGYRGNDIFYVTEGKFIRSFPLYEGAGKSAKLTTQKRIIEYGLRNNQFTVKQLSKDSPDDGGKHDTAIISKATTVKQDSGKNKSHHKKAEKHRSKKHQSSKHTKKHKKSRNRRHHHTSEE